MFIDIFVCSAKEQLEVGYGAIWVYIIIIIIIIILMHGKWVVFILCFKIV